MSRYQLNIIKVSLLVMAVFAIPLTSLFVGSQAYASTDLAAVSFQDDELQATQSDVIASGTCGTCTWTIDADGLLTIEPTDGVSGTLAEYPSDNRFDFGKSWPWQPYDDSYGSGGSNQINAVRVAEGVKAGQNACGLFSCLSVDYLDISALDTSETTNMESFFVHTHVSKEKVVLPIDVSNVTNMSSMFYQSQFDAGWVTRNWNTSKVSNFDYMFGFHYGISDLTISFDITGAESVFCMFHCLTLNCLDLTEFDNRGVDCAAMFNQCCIDKLKVGSTFSFDTLGQMPGVGAHIVSGVYTPAEKWWSVKAQRWFTPDEVKASRSGIADTYCATEVYDISEAEVTGIVDKTYTGSEILQSDFQVTINGKTLTKDVDYTIAYRNNLNAGTATVTIAGMGDTIGTKEVTFSIGKATIEVPVARTDLIYTGEELTGVEAGEGYSVEGGSAVDAGTYTARVIADSNHQFPGGAATASVEWSIAMSSGWHSADGKWYYYRADGTMAVSKWEKISGKWYHFDAAGAMEASKWIRDSKGWCYVGASGAMVTNGWAKDSKGWCYMDADGYAVTSKWLKVDGKWYYFDANARMVASKWMKDSKGWVYLDSSGAMATDKWVKDSKGWCYVGSDGYAVHDQWKKDSKGWCYLDENCRLTIGWKQIKGTWYYFDADGRMVTGAQTIGGKTYRFADNGAWLG